VILSLSGAQFYGLARNNLQLLAQNYIYYLENLFVFFLIISFLSSNGHLRESFVNILASVPTFQQVSFKREMIFVQSICDNIFPHIHQKTNRLVESKFRLWVKKF